MSIKMLPDRLLGMLSPADKKALGKAGVTCDEHAAKADVKSERELQGQIANYLRLHGIWFDQDSMAHRRRGTKGAPDFLCVFKGVPLGLEAKFGDGKLSGDQVAAHEAMTRNGWRVKICRSVADVQKLLRDIDNETKL